MTRRRRQNRRRRWSGWVCWQPADQTKQGGNHDRAEQACDSAASPSDRVHRRAVVARLNGLGVIVPMAAPMTVGVRGGVMIDIGPGKLVARHLSVAKRTS